MITVGASLTVIQKWHEAVIPAGIAGIQTTWTYLSLPSMALDTRFPAGMTSSYILVYNDEGST